MNKWILVLSRNMTGGLQTICQLWLDHFAVLAYMYANSGHVGGENNDDYKRVCFEG